MMLRSIFAAGLLAAALTPANAHTVIAQTDGTTVVKISTVELDLTKPAGQAALYARVDSVVRHINAPEPNSGVAELARSQDATSAELTRAHAQVEQRIAAAQTGSSFAMAPVAVRAVR
jgi:UrcA family protein